VKQEKMVRTAQTENLHMSLQLKMDTKARKLSGSHLLLAKQAKMVQTARTVNLLTSLLLRMDTKVLSPNGLHLL
jgi:hypothetical protein